MGSNKYDLFLKLIEAFDKGCKYVDDYNALLHNYGGVIMYQAESQFIRQIGLNPGITITELAAIFDKTKSACSQLMRRMKEKGWIYQERNKENNREFRLFLTEAGQKIYVNHREFEDACYQRTINMLDAFSEKELQTYIDIQKQLNKAFKLDVEESINNEEIKNKIS